MGLYFVEPEEALDYIYNLLDDNKGPLGLKYVGYADERFLSHYPAAVVSYNAPLARELYASRQFRLLWSIQIIVHHARLSASHKTRTREDMRLAADVRNKLHQDFKLGGGVIFGYVEEERPGIMMDDKGQVNIATTLIWSGESRQTF